MKADKPFVSAIILAAGSGARMGGVSKPLIKLGNKTLLERVVETFSDCKSVGEIIVVTKDADVFAPLIKTGKPFSFAEGGKSRADSAANGVKAAKKADFVCIHDCARPFITVDEVEKLISEAIKTGASCACTRVTDTVKYISEEEKCLYTPKRDNLRAVQTPQIFKKDVYIVSRAKALKDGFVSTDDTSIAEHAGFTVSYVECSPLNMKLTTPDDIKIAKAINFLEERGNIL